jgi:hypothetical protein
MYKEQASAQIKNEMGLKWVIAGPGRVGLRFAVNACQIYAASRTPKPIALAAVCIVLPLASNALVRLGRFFAARETSDDEASATPLRMSEVCQKGAGMVPSACLLFSFTNMGRACMLMSTAMPDTLGGALRGCMVALHGILQHKKSNVNVNVEKVGWWVAIKEAALLEPGGLGVSIVPGYEPIDMFRIIRLGELTMNVGMLLIV